MNFQFHEFFFQIFIWLALISQILCQTVTSTTDTDIYNTETTTIYDLEPFPFPPAGRAPQEKTVSFLDYNSQDNDCSAFFDLTRFEIVTPKGQLKYDISQFKIFKKELHLPSPFAKTGDLFWPDFPKFHFFVDQGGANRKDWSE